MEKIVTSELSKILIILGMGVAGISALLIRMIGKIRGSFKPYQMATILYLLILFILFAFIGCTANWLVLKEHLAFYISYQLFFFLLGSAHLFWMRKFLKWTGDHKSLRLEFLLTVIVSMLGYIGFLIVYQFFNKDGLEYDMVTSIFPFLIPWFILQTFRCAIAIPQRIFKQWFYPLNQEIEEPDEKKMKHLLVISFEFQKQVTDTHYTNFRAKAPVDMDLGELFYYFINDYNERHPNALIQYIDSDGEPHGWIFYKKPKWYTINMQFFDADKTIYKNRIRENDVIICSRSLN